MELKLKKLMDVWTKDGKHLGQAEHLFHRTEEIKPEWGFYPHYLYVFSFDVGDDYYVPTDFIAETNGKVTLSVTMDEVMEKTWTRLPNFIMEGKAEKEDLPTT